MPDPNEEVEIEEEDGGEKETAIQKTLQDLTSKVGTQTQVVAKILEDPGVRAVLAARERGLEVRVETGTKDDEPDPEEVDLDQLDNPALVKHLAEKVLPGVLKKALRPLTDEILSLRAIREQEAEATLDQQVAEAKKAFPDFKDYHRDMLMVAKDNPSLSVKELYFIAKSRKGAGLTVNPGSERPTTATGKTRGKPPPKMAPGKAGFEARLANALSGLEIEE